MTKLQLLFNFGCMVSTLILGYFGLNWLPSFLYVGVFCGWSFYFFSSSYILIQQTIAPKEEHLILFAPSFLVASVLFGLVSVIQIFPLWGSYLIAQFTVVALQGISFYYNIHSDDFFSPQKGDQSIQAKELYNNKNEVDKGFMPIPINISPSDSADSSDSSDSLDKEVDCVRELSFD